MSSREEVVLCKGTLTKRSAWLQVWRERHFTVVGTTLRFHRTSASAPHGTIDISALRTLPTDLDVDGREHCFVVQTGAGKKFALSATSDRERRAWKSVIGAAKFLPRLQTGAKMIKHGVVKSREVFFSLSDDGARLCYHDFQGSSPGAVSNAKDIPMASVAGVRDLSSGPGSTTFSITDHERTHRIDVCDASEKGAWVMALTQAAEFRKAAAGLGGFGNGAEVSADRAEEYAAQQQAAGQRSFLAGLTATRESDRAKKKAYREQMRAKYNMPPGD